MILRLGYDIQFEIVPASVPIVALLNVHPSRVADLRAPDEFRVEPAATIDSFIDGFGNRCVRFVAQHGALRSSNSTLIYDSGEPDPQSPNAREVPVQELPHEVLRYLYNSRYCEVDRSRPSHWNYLAQRLPDFGVCRLFAIGYTPELVSDISTPVPRRPL